MHTKKLSHLLAGRVVSRVEDSPEGGLQIHFADDSILAIVTQAGGVVATFRAPETDPVRGKASERPAARQREYLDFIGKYMARFGVSPAETDIQRHFNGIRAIRKSDGQDSRAAWVHYSSTRPLGAGRSAFDPPHGSVVLGRSPCELLQH